MTVAEFFCGCGGLSHGFARAGFKVLLGNDIKPEALRTFEHNHPGAVGILQDVRDLDLANIKEVLARQGAGDSLDCLIGGPPCQGFSKMRRTEHRDAGRIERFSGYDRLGADPRNALVLRFLEIAAALMPRFVVIENVPQMLRHGYKGRLGGLAKEVRQTLEDLGYAVESRVLNAADYGVPQLRERAIFLAHRDGPISFPEPTHAGRHITVGEALFDLPLDPPMGADPLAGASLDTYTEPPNRYTSRLRTADRFPPNHLTRRYKQRILDIIAQMRPGETWDAASARMRAHGSALVGKQGLAGETPQQTRARLIADGAINPVFEKSYYWSAYSRLDPKLPALTITANANFLGSGRFTHPERDRGITVREAARLQSFDDAFAFITRVDRHDTTRIGVAMDMVGEAVPPLLAMALAEHLKSFPTHSDRALVDG